MADPELVLRRAERGDLPRLLELIPRSVRGLSRAHYTDAQIESAIRHVFGPDTQLIDDGTYFVVAAGAELVACGGWSRRRTLFGGDQTKRGADPLLDPAHEAARIRAFFVAPDWARRGLGSRLMDACLEAARAAGFRALELAATLPGEPLYRGYGFLPVERTSTALPDGQSLPLVYMRRALDVR
ncbi:MAG TPA: GNAT family N-acetyltransferase [Myxococcota bacterium]|nr:GNAT family N-acetyltransferase [Myxococcota bacterium]